MYSSSHNAMQQYKSTKVESAVFEASPHRLIGMLLEGAIERTMTAKLLLANGDVARKGEMIGWVISILEGLRASLDMSKGGEIADNLSALYDYMGRRLMEANLKSDPAILDEVVALLLEIKAGWEGIAESVGDMNPSGEVNRPTRSAFSLGV
ncbi:MAG: flagellar export chaperone FliS [Gammaproteobacteria bacterium]|nr:flagellar export chaperone FliS [Gammaproteobacteria bacterium]